MLCMKDYAALAKEGNHEILEIFLNVFGRFRMAIHIFNAWNYSFQRN